MASDQSGEGTCPKCGWDEVTADRTTTGVQEGVVFTSGVDAHVAVTCDRCGYTESYAPSGDSVPLDLFFGREWVAPSDREQAAWKSSEGIYHCGTCGTAFTDDLDERPGCGRQFI